jgi:Predicted membrane protein
MNNELTYKYFTDDDFLRISNKIKDTEKSTSGEICVSIKEKKPFFSRRKSVKDLAVDEFIRLGIKKTQDNTGVLIFILLKERQFYVLADSAINEKVPEKTWDSIKEEMQDMFKQGKFCKGITQGLEKIGKILSDHFPIKPGDINELSNKVVLN